ncbi:MAG: TlpA family protein disulfide reductase [Acidobacteria bacterium]|nr:TlpA family protein disulfide reductase [Acidobacteriaceae bacterium]MBV9610172.1 TlpA family protein disulfide reductase [Acidobacteriota bacterium]
MRRIPALLLLALAILGGCDRGSKPTLVGGPAPDFTVEDADRKVALHDLKGKIVVLNFWATWCPPCVEEMPSLVKMQQQMKNRNVVVLAVSVDDDERSYRTFLKKNNVDLLTVRDPRQKSNELYGSFKFPETYIIDQSGVLRRKFIGAVDWTRPDVIEYLNKL